MKRGNIKLLLKLLAAVNIALVLIVVALVSLPSGNRLARASSGWNGALEPPPGNIPLASGGVTLSLTAVTDNSSNGSTVAAGSVITYFITLTNAPSASALTTVTIASRLPPATLIDLTCGTASPDLTCGVATETVVIPPKPPGDTVSDTQVITTGLQWLANELSPSQSVTATFTGKVACQPDGYLIVNYAVADYYYNNQLEGTFSDPVNTRVQVEPPEQSQLPFISTFPGFCSEDKGGLVDMDWGDYDADGDLDLALVSNNSKDGGVLVYRNNGRGQLTRLSVYSNQTVNWYLRSVRWADLDRDGRLDLLVTGKYEYQGVLGSTGPGGAVYPYTGYNYIFLNKNPSTFELVRNGSDSNGQDYSFQSNDGMARAAAVDFDTDGLTDIALGNNYSDPGGGCGVQINRNLGTSEIFRRAIPGSIWQEGYPSYNWDILCLEEAVSVKGLDWGDYNNDGLPDLAVSFFDPPTYVIKIFNNTKQTAYPYKTQFTAIAAISGTELCAPPCSLYDIKWGDYDNDGFLDLVAALKNGVGIYGRKQNPFKLFAPKSVFTLTGSTIQSVDWLDFDRDGQLELAVGSNPVKICDRFTANSADCSKQIATTGDGTVIGVHGVDYDNDGDLDLSYVYSADYTFVSAAYAPLLSRQLTELNSSADGSGVVWADVLGNGQVEGGQDLLLAASRPLGVRLYLNSNGQLSSAPAVFGFPANGIAAHDLDNDGDLDIAAATINQEMIYRYDETKESYPAIPDWKSTSSETSQGLIFGDFDLDNAGLPELMVANQGANTFYLNQGLLSDASPPIWWTDEEENSYSLAWTYYDDDIFPDILVGNSNSPNRIYLGNGDNTFSLQPDWKPGTLNTRSVAWGDYDGDGDMDLAVGNYDQGIYIYTKQNGVLDSTEIWSSTETHLTTSVAWGDWDNDGDLDLAVGNEGQPDQVYMNLGSDADAEPALSLFWQSDESFNTRAVAWGDVDGDGDLELAVAAKEKSGYYQNNLVSPAHLGLTYRPLPLNPSYLSFDRPGSSNFIWYRELLTDEMSLRIPITQNLHLYDPDGPNQNGARDSSSIVVPVAKVVTTTKVEYSVNGGKWHPATTDAAMDFWQAGVDLDNSDTKNAVSDDVRLRVTVVHENKQGPVQRATSSATSPPFRVRNLECVWPDDVSVTYAQVFTYNPFLLQFTGSAVGGGDGLLGQMSFEWNFGGVITTGQVVQHTLPKLGSYVVTLTVKGKDCPVTRPKTVTSTVLAGRELTKSLYLPLILKSGASQGAPVTSMPQTDMSILNVTPDSPPQVTDLVGYIQHDGTLLQWNFPSPDGAVLGYRIYRSPMGMARFQLLAEVPAQVITYTDADAVCGYMYLVTAYNDLGESLPGTSSYFSPPCR